MTRSEQTDRPTRANTRPTHRGMTLVEVLAVVVILGLLAGTLAVGFSGAFRKGKHELAKTAIGLLVARVELYGLEHDGRLPDSTVGLAALSDGQASPTASYYVSADKLLDPWNRPYQFLVPGPGGHPFEIVTFGADGQPGGIDDNEDLSSVNLRGIDE